MTFIESYYSDDVFRKAKIQELHFWQLLSPPPRRHQWRKVTRGGEKKPSLSSLSPDEPISILFPSPIPSCFRIFLPNMKTETSFFWRIIPLCSGISSTSPLMQLLTADKREFRDFLNYFSLAVSEFFLGLSFCFAHFFVCKWLQG